MKNVAIVKRRRYTSGNTVSWAPAVVVRDSYQIVEVVDECASLVAAVTLARACATEKKLPLYVSTAYYGRPEVQGIDMLGVEGPQNAK